MRAEVERLLERLQTGWRPRPDEIDMRIRQRKIFDWQVAPSFLRPEPVLIGRPESREGVIRTDVILWIDARLRWGLCEDGLWWLEGS